MLDRYMTEELVEVIKALASAAASGYYDRVLMKRFADDIQDYGAIRHGGDYVEGPILNPARHEAYPH